MLDFLREEITSAESDGLPLTAANLKKVVKELERLLVMEAKLPETLDHVRIVPGVDPVFRRRHCGFGLYDIEKTYVKRWLTIATSYSSHMAAEAAQKAKEVE